MYSSFVDATCDYRMNATLMAKQTIETKTVTTPEQESSITPKPTIAEVFEPTDIAQSERNVPWSFNDGCIWKEWSFLAPIYLGDNVEDILIEDKNNQIICDGWDTSWFGYEAINYEGLRIYKNNYDAGGSPLVFGLLREVPENVSNLFLSFYWEQFSVNQNNDDELQFNIGFVDSSGKIDTGSFIKFYMHNEIDGPNILRQDGSPDGNYIGWSAYSGNRTVAISCEFEGSLSVECTFDIDRDAEKAITKIISLPENWNSLYLGTQVPNGATIQLTIDNLIITAIEN